MRTKKEELIGKRFGRLIALEVYEKDKKNGHWFIKCKCDCGKTTLVRTNHLNSNHIQSCGCLLLEKLHNGVKPHKVYEAFDSIYTIEEIEEKFKIPRITFYRRIKKGMTIEEALTLKRNARYKKGDILNETLAL